MKKVGEIIALTLAMGSLTLSAAAFAHGTEKHGKTAAAGAQMKKLHEMMPMFSVAAAGVESALEKGEMTAVEIEADRILDSIPDLKKSKPHKNVKQRKKFVEITTKLEEAVTSTVVLAKKDDLAGAKVAFKKVEETCAACHAKFRD
ncbi:MAG: cytochrome c [Desulfuromonadaceae bacterium]|nr:cytochrome c [Desulfuromonadaceae bacterium]